MNSNNNNKSNKGARNAAVQGRKQLKKEILDELRAAAGQPAKGKGRGKRNRQAKAAARAAGGQSLTGRGSTRNSSYGNKDSFPVEESEYIAEIVPTAFPAFSVQSFPINPGQATSFPWLSSIAKNFDKYEFERLCFVYKREVSEFAANGVTGKVIMYFDPDASDPTPVNKQQMEDSEPHSDCMPSENMRLEVPKEMLAKINSDARFVRPGTQPANTDLKTYDLGNLFVACQGTAANTAVGELHVEYRLRLRVPVLVTGSGIGVLVAGGAPIAAATPMGSAPVNTGQIQLAAAATNVITMTGLAVGSEISVNVQLIGTVFTAINLTTPVGLTLKNTLFAGFPAAATTAAAISTYTVTAANASLVLSVTATTVTQGSIQVAALTPAPSV